MGFRAGDGLADVESVEKGAVVDGDGVLGTMHEAEGGGKNIGYFVGSGMKMDGRHSRVRVWSQRLRWSVANDEIRGCGDVPGWNAHVENEPRRGGNCVL